MSQYYLSKAGTSTHSNFVVLAAQGDANFGAGITYFSLADEEDSATPVEQFQLIRLTGGTAPVTQALEKGNSRSPTASTTGHVDWTTGPSFSGNPLILWSSKEFTGINYLPRNIQWWLTNPRYPIVLDPSGYIGIGTWTGQFNIPYDAGLGIRETTFNVGQRRIARRGRNRGFWHQKDFRSGFQTAGPNVCRIAPEFYMIQGLDWSLAQMPQQWNINLFGGATGNLFTQSVDGTLTPAGALINQINKNLLAGTLTPSANVFKFTTKTMAGTITPAGALTKLTSKTMSGTITPTGTLLAQVVFTKVLTGGLSFSGQLVKMTLKSLIGILTPTGALNKQTSKTMGGTLNFTGTLLHNATFVRALTGTLNAIADLVELFIPGTPATGTDPNWVSTWIKSVWKRGGK